MPTTPTSQHEFKTPKNTISMSKKIFFFKFQPHFARAPVTVICFVFVQLHKNLYFKDKNLIFSEFRLRFDPAYIQ